MERGFGRMGVRDIVGEGEIALAVGGKEFIEGSFLDFLYFLFGLFGIIKCRIGSYFIFLLLDNRLEIGGG
jgi:hypothetical protein